MKNELDIKPFNYRKHSLILILAGIFGLIPVGFFIGMNDRNFDAQPYVVFYLAHCLLVIFSGVLLRKSLKKGLISLTVAGVLFIVAFFIPQPPIGDSSIQAWSFGTNLFTFSVVMPFELSVAPFFVPAGIGNAVFLIGSFIEIINIRKWKQFLKLKLI